MRSAGEGRAHSRLRPPWPPFPTYLGLAVPAPVSTSPRRVAGAGSHWLWGLVIAQSYPCPSDT